MKAALVLSALFLTFSFNRVGAQIILDQSVNGNGLTTYSITTTQPNELILVAAGAYGTLSNAAGTVTVNGNNATYENEGIEFANGDYWSTLMWAYVATTAGTYTITCTEAGAESPFYFNYAASVYEPATVLGLGNIILGGNGHNYTYDTVSAEITTTVANSFIFGYELFNDNGNTGTVTWTTLTELQHNYISDGIDGAIAGATLAAGSYKVLVTDAGADNPYAVVDLIAVQPSGGCTLTATASVTDNVLCFGGSTGSASVTASGGTSPYTYSWSPSGGTNATASDLSADTYTVVVTDHAGCTETENVTITQPTQLTATITDTTGESCNGGSNGTIGVTARGGTSPYTYAWSPGGGTNALMTGLSAGNYTVTVKDNNDCSATATETITQPSAVTITIASHTNASCSALGNATANAATGGGGTFTYNWTPSGGTNLTASGLSAGTYTITATDQYGCTGSASVTITQAASTVAITIASHTNAICNTPGSATANAATGGTAPYTYAWTPSGGTNLNATGLSAGTYTITATDNKGCTGTASVIITQLVSTINISIASSTNVICNTLGSATANAATGGTFPYNYAWTPSGGTNLSTSNLSAGTYTITATDSNGCTGSASVTISQAASTLAITIASTVNQTCAGLGSATANAATGGTSPYTYTWSPSGGTNLAATSLSAGTYTITAEDINGCTATASATIADSASTISISIASSTNLTCKSLGTATANPASGGTAPYTYSWSPSGGTNLLATGLSAGTYTITAIDNNGCTGTASVTITPGPASLSISIASKTTLMCEGFGYITAHAPTGGTPPYSYIWSPSGGTNLMTTTNLTAGTYTITATDSNGCTATASETISYPAHLNISATVTGNLNCYGGNDASASATATGGTPAYTYQWSPSGGTNSTESGLSAGTYTITVTDSLGCTSTTTVIISEPPGMVITTDSVDVHGSGGCNGAASVTVVSGGTPPYTYKWVGGQTTDSITGQCAGDYCVVVTDNKGCSQTTCVVVSSTVGIENIYGNSSAITIFPDPNTGVFTIKGLEKGMTLEMYDDLGRNIGNIKATGETMQLDISTQPGGMYLIRILTDDGTLVGQKKMLKTQ